MKKITLFVLLFAFITQVGYSQTKEIYTNPKFTALAKNHKLLAIIPFEVTMKLRPKEMDKLSPEQFAKMQKDEGKGVQSALESYFLKKKGQKGFTVDFQEISKTNALLAKAGITQDNLVEYTTEDLAKILGVDGVISGTLYTNKPLSDGASVALGLVFGFYGPTNSGKCMIKINDAGTGNLLWKYEKTLSRSLGSDTNTIINAMMRKASRKFPYASL